MEKKSTREEINSNARSTNTSFWDLRLSVTTLTISSKTLKSFSVLLLMFTRRVHKRGQDITRFCLPGIISEDLLNRFLRKRRGSPNDDEEHTNSNCSILLPSTDDVAARWGKETDSAEKVKNDY